MSRLPGSTRQPHDKQQGYIAPVSLLVTEQYGNALKYLLTTKCHYKIIGNSYLVFWAAHDEDNSLATAFSMAGFGRQESDFDSEEDEALYHTVTSILSGNESVEKYADQLEDLNADFYVMVLRNHNVRFALTEFQHCTFGQMLENLRAHLKRATIISSRDGEGQPRSTCGYVRQPCPSNYHEHPIPQRTSVIAAPAYSGGWGSL